MNAKKVLIPLTIVTMGLSSVYYLEKNYHIKAKLNNMFAKQSNVEQESIEQEFIELTLVSNN